MVTFFSVLVILLGVNAFLLFFSVNYNAKRSQKNADQLSEETTTNIYPLNSMDTKFKKAV
ncbi:hypothetical protein [Cellulophaga sp. Hel_I_12]|uniref:hypothetical protein n=1 Tax=Cellulophaga sp. Hel_I_12 TaxID=1249972 RepID=UPI00064634A2|nr:hypothetical protein [Cellulophaga sp. Hel_I_12]